MHVPKYFAQKFVAFSETSAVFVEPVIGEHRIVVRNMKYFLLVCLLVCKLHAPVETLRIKNLRLCSTHIGKSAVDNKADVFSLKQENGLSATSNTVVTAAAAAINIIQSVAGKIPDVITSEDFFQNAKNVIIGYPFEKVNVTLLYTFSCKHV